MPPEPQSHNTFVERAQPPLQLPLLSSHGLRYQHRASAATYEVGSVERRIRPGSGCPLRTSLPWVVVRSLAPYAHRLEDQDRPSVAGPSPGRGATQRGLAKPIPHPSIRRDYGPHRSM